ncbi:MAG TPA: hypothetical protein VGL38_01765, partial [bacterium]
MLKEQVYLCLSALLLCFPSFAASPLPQTAFFVQNEGQWDGAFSFKYDAPGATYFLTSSGMTLDLHSPEPRTAPDQLCHPEARLRAEGPRASLVHGHMLKLSYINANPNPVLLGEDKLPSYSNYFLSKDSCKWRSRVGHYRSVTAQDVWPGIDVQYRIGGVGAHSSVPVGIETVYHLHPGADPNQIQLRYEGQDGAITVDANGSLLLSTSLGLVTEKAPFAYQTINHTQIEIPCRYDLTAEGGYRLVLGPYDATKEVVIDPLVYGSFLGGGGADEVRGMALSPNRQIVLCGMTDAQGFPITPGAYQQIGRYEDGFVTKLSLGGDSLIFSTYFNAKVVAVSTDSQGHVFASGNGNQLLPLTPNAFDTTLAGYEGAIAEFSAGGDSLLLSSYLGGSGADFANGLAVGNDGRAYIVGLTRSVDFPVTSNAAFPTPRPPVFDGEAFLTVIDPVTVSIIYSTFIPGSSSDEAYGVHAPGPDSVWVTGRTQSSDFPTTPDALQLDSGGREDGFFCLFNTQSGALRYSSYLGGSNTDYVSDIASIDGQHMVITGNTFSADFPVTPGAFDTLLTPDMPKGFVLIMQWPDSLVAATFLGGRNGDSGVEVAADADGIVVAGETRSNDFPVTHGAFDTLLNTNGQPTDWYWDAFVSRLSPDLAHLEYSTYLGGQWTEYLQAAAFSSPDTVWLAGQTGSGDFPITPNAVQSQYRDFGDGFIACFAVPNPAADAVPQPFIPPPSSFILSCFPNPFNPTTTLSFTLPASSEVKLEVFDVLGRSVYQQNLGRLTAGEH